MALLLSIRSVLPLPPSMEGVGIKESTFIVLKTRWFSHKLVFEGFSSVEAWGGSMALEEMKKTSSLSKLNENETFPYCILSWVQLHQYHQLGLREEKKVAIGAWIHSSKWEIWNALAKSKYRLHFLLQTFAQKMVSCLHWE